MENIEIANLLVNGLLAGDHLPQIPHTCILFMYKVNAMLKTLRLSWLLLLILLNRMLQN